MRHVRFRARAVFLPVAAVIAMAALAPGTASAATGTATVTISATPKRITSGGTVTLSGTVTEAGAPVPGTPVTVDVNDALSGYSSKRATTGTAGDWSVRVKVKGDVSATASAANLVSNGATVNVTAVAKARLKLAATVARPWLLDPAKVSVAPADYVLPVLQVRHPGSATWHTVPDAGGVWGTKAGTLYVRVVVTPYGHGVLARKVSAPVRVTVRKGKVPGWLRELNAYRRLNDAPPVASDARFSRGEALHVRYMQKTGDFTHTENPKSKWYTKLGAEAGASSDLFLGEPDPIKGWAQAPYHALAELNRFATVAGYSSNGFYSALRVGSAGFPQRNPRGPLYQFPANGKTTSLRTYYGAEFPDPLSKCPWAWRNREQNWKRVGLPVIFGNRRTVTRPSATLAVGGKGLRVCVMNAGIYGNAVFVIPLLPLKRHHRYTVTVKYKGKLQSRWRFRTR